MKQIDGVYYFNSDTFLPHQIKVQYNDIKSYADQCDIPYRELIFMLKGFQEITPRYKNIFINTLGLTHSHSKAKLFRFIDRTAQRQTLNKVMSSIDSVSKYELMEVLKFLKEDKG